MVSARRDPEPVATLRDFTARHGMPLSDVLREAAVQIIARETVADLITFDITVINVPIIRRRWCWLGLLRSKENEEGGDGEDDAVQDRGRRQLH